MAEPIAIPLGRREGPTLEFKAAAALRAPEKIGREVVGFLNASGGDVWIGVSEQDGVAATVEPIEDPGLARRALLDHLIATIEPAPVDEIQVEPVTDRGGACVLRIHVEKPHRRDRPYSYRVRDLRYFGVRVADRLRTMSSDEIFARSDLDEGAKQRWTEATAAVRKRLTAAEEAKQPVVWLCLHPVEPLRLTFDAGTQLLFTDPVATDNRPSGWTFVNRRANHRRYESRVVHGEPGGPCTQVSSTGEILFTAPLHLLYWKGERQLIWPYILMELTVSVFRLARALYGAVEEPGDDRVAAQLALVSARGWKLKSGSVRSLQWELEQASRLESSTAVSELRDPRLPQIVSTPDLCARPLLEDIYQEFGLEREDLPSEFDPIRGLELGS